MSIRILADDLTGALDSAACFTGEAGALAVRWALPAPGAGSFALSTETRDLGREAAVRRVREAAPALPGAALMFKKVDSLLRGHVAAEVAAAMGAAGIARAVLAPAFPQQRRVTRGGRQHVLADARSERVAVDVGAELRAFGIAATADPRDLGRTGPVAWIADAETDADLARIAAQGRAAPGPLLWCGTAGLAAALAARPAAGARLPRGRVLAICGTDHPVARAQVLAAAATHGPPIRLAPEAADVIARTLRERGAAMLAPELPATSRAAAREAIGDALARLLPAIAPPDVLIVMGGETLRQCCDALGAGGLSVEALVAPGIPQARMTGGAWADTPIVSKSGAFGEADTLLRLIALASRDGRRGDAGARESQNEGQCA